MRKGTAPGGVSGSFRVVVDIGTTTLVVSLVDLNLGEEVATEHAEDALSRIRMAADDHGMAELHHGVLAESQQSGVPRERNFEVVLVAIPAGTLPSG